MTSKDLWLQSSDCNCNNLTTLSRFYKYDGHTICVGVTLLDITSMVRCSIVLNEDIQNRSEGHHHCLLEKLDCEIEYYFSNVNQVIPKTQCQGREISENSLVTTKTKWGSEKLINFAVFKVSNFCECLQKPTKSTEIVTLSISPLQNTFNPYQFCKIWM